MTEQLGQDFAFERSPPVSEAGAQMNGLSRPQFMRG